MSLVSWYLRRRRNRRILRELNQNRGEPRGQKKPIKNFRHGNVVGSVWAELHNGETQIRASFNLPYKKNGKTIWYKSFPQEDLPDVCDAALECLAYMDKLRNL